MKFWINTISRDHVERGVAGGFTQANHGKPNGLKQLNQADWLVLYSPTTSYEGGETLQAFTAIGQIADNELYQVEMSAAFMPWRRNVRFISCRQAPIRPMIEQLDFIADKTHWGYKFRLGLFEISQRNFELIVHSMGIEIKETE